MSCERFREAIAGHAAGEDISGAAAAHITSCESCRAEVERRRRLLAEVDAELSRTLSLSASPDFVARVTSSVSSIPSRSVVWRPAVAWGGLAAAAAIATVAFLRAPAPAPQLDAPPKSASAGPAPIAAVSTPAAAVSTPAAAVPATAAARRTAARRSHSRSLHVTAPRPAGEPPVVIDPAQARAIARFRELVNAGRLNGTLLPPERPHDATELAVAPLEIPEIKMPGVEFAGRPPGSGVEPEPKEH